MVAAAPHGSQRLLLVLAEIGGNKGWYLGMVPGNSADRSVGRDWITQCLSASERPPPSKMERSPPTPNTGTAFPLHDGARPRAAHLSAKSGGHPAWERSMSLRSEPVGEIPADTKSLRA